MSAEAAGIHDIPADDYHSDLIDHKRPSLSKSLAHILLTQSPAHAKAAHPRLSHGYRRQEEEKFDVGNCVHSILLEGANTVEIVEANDWRTAAAKQARADARANGKVPLLEKQWAVVQEMLEAVKEQTESFPVDPPLLANGKPEQTIVWDEDGVLCRARIDWLHDDLRAVDDIKTTSRVAGANPDSWSRTLYGIGADLQVAFYLRGLKAVTGMEPDWRFIVMETEPPYALSVISLAPSVIALANEKVNVAIDIWRDCLKNDSWDGYPRRVCFAELPAWEEARFLERDALRAAA